MEKLNTMGKQGFQRNWFFDEKKGTPHGPYLVFSKPVIFEKVKRILEFGKMSSVSPTVDDIINLPLKGNVISGNKHVRGGTPPDVYSAVRI